MELMAVKKNSLTISTEPRRVITVASLLPPIFSGRLFTKFGQPEVFFSRCCLRAGLSSCCVKWRTDGRGPQEIGLPARTARAPIVVFIVDVAVVAVVAIAFAPPSSPSLRRRRRCIHVIRPGEDRRILGTLFPRPGGGPRSARHSSESAAGEGSASPAGPRCVVGRTRR